MNHLVPGITSDEYKPERNFEIFQKRTEGWIFAPAKRISANEDSGIAVMILASTILQPIGAILKPGKNESEFCEGFLYTFPSVPGSKNPTAVAKEVYNLLRNGLYHEAFIKPGLFIRNQSNPVEIESDVVYIEPKLFLGEVESAFRRLCGEISKDKALHESFERYIIRRDTETALKRKAPIDPAVYTNPTTLSTSAHSAVTAPWPTSATIPLRKGPA